jgi:thioredoxin reductase (NADPH)
MQELLKGYANIAIRYNVEPKKIVGNDEQVTGIELLDSNSNQTEIMPIDGVFLAIGHLPNTALFKETLDLDANGYITLKGRSQETSVQGVFAAGDVEDHRYRQAGVAAGSGIKAALDVGAFLNEIGFNDAFAAQLQTTLAKSSSESHSSAGSLVKKVQTIDEFDTAMAAAKTPLFVDFYADYCPSCMQMLPHFDAVSQEYKNLATFVSVDIDKLPEVSKKYFVTKIPALLVFKEGKLVARYNSALTKRELQDLAAQIVAESPAE